MFKAVNPFATGRVYAYEIHGVNAVRIELHDTNITLVRFEYNEDDPIMPL